MGVVSAPVPGGPAAPGKPLSGDARKQAMARLQFLRQQVQLGFEGKHLHLDGSIPDEIKKVKGTLGVGRRLPGRADLRAAYQERQGYRAAAYKQGKNDRRAQHDASHTDYHGAQKGGTTANGNPQQAMTNLGTAMTNFDKVAVPLTKALSSIPHSIEMTVNAKHEFIFNGAETLAAIMPSMTNLMEDKARSMISSSLKKNFPDANIS